MTHDGGMSAGMPPKLWSVWVGTPTSGRAGLRGSTGSFGAALRKLDDGRRRGVTKGDAAPLPVTPRSRRGGERAHALRRLRDELVHHRLQVAGALERRELAVGARAVLQDAEGVLHLAPAPEFVEHVVHEPLDPILPNDFNYDQGLTPAFTGEFVWSVIKHGILPAATILITAVGGWILTMRNNMVTTLAEDYVRMARAKGIPSRKIMFGYAGRNAFLPNLSGFAMSLGFVISGTILVEYVFNYPGLGYMFYNATVSTDYPLLQALFLLVTLAVLICVLLCDFAVFLLDPRARTKG
jgi:hypothetical protein